MSDRLRAIAASLGGEVRGNRATIPGPGHSRRDRSLSLLDTGTRFVWHSFANDHQSEVVAYLESHGLACRGEVRPMTVEERRRFAKERAKADAERVEAQLRKAHCVWREGEDYDLGGVRAYLSHRSVPLETIELAIASGAIRSHRDGYGRLAMLALARAYDGRPRAVQKTNLRVDGRGKRGDPARFTFGPAKGAAVQLMLPEGGAVAICEGIEDALAFRALHGIAAWAALGTAGVMNFVPPKGLSRLYIATDGDAAGRAAAESLFERLKSRLRCILAIAPEGLDWADVLAMNVRGDGGA